MYKQASYLINNMNKSILIDSLTKIMSKFQRNWSVALIRIYCNQIEIKTMKEKASRCGKIKLKCDQIEKHYKHH